MCIIDDERQRLARSHVRRQPVQPVQQGKGVGVSPELRRTRVGARRLDHGERKCGGAYEQLASATNR